MTSRMLKHRISASREHQTTLTMRAGATIRAVGVQQPGEICLWAEVPFDSPLEPRTFRVVPTGGDLPDVGNYIGTAFDGPFVWHVYEVAS